MDFAIQQATQKPKTVNSYQYARLRNQALINDGMVQQTNLVYPSGIYNSLSVESGKGQIIKSVKVRTLSSVW
jgi:hypothetical protein